MRVRTFLLTFLVYMTLHMMRMSYSFCKPFYRKYFNASDILVAVVDSSTYIGLGVGFVFRAYLTQHRQLLQTCFYYTLLSTLFYSILPIFTLIMQSTMQQKQIQISSWMQAILVTSMLGFGFLQLCLWGTCLILINDYFSVENDGGIMGFWSTFVSEFGNIMGFLAGSLLVLNLGVRWELLMIGVAGLMLLSITLFKAFLKLKWEPPAAIDDQLHPPAQVQTSSSDHYSPTYQQFITTTKTYLKNPKILIYLGNCCIYKSITYGFLLWLPTYLQSIHLKHYMGIIPIIVSVSSIIGGYLIGLVYEKASQEGFLKRYIFLVISFVVMVLLIMLNTLPVHLALFIPQIALMSSCVGGYFANLSCNQVIQLTGKDTKKMSILTNLMMAVGNTSIGITSLTIGFYISFSRKKKGGEAPYKMFMVVLLVISGLGVLLELYKVYRKNRQNKAGEQLGEKQQDGGAAEKQSIF